MSKEYSPEWIVYVENIGDKIFRKNMRGWLLYLDNISDEKCGDLARSLWLRVVSISEDIPVPTAAPFDDYTGFYFAWDNKEHHIDIEISRETKIAEWFYRNRKDNATNGGDGLSNDFRERLKLVMK
jgi:hypothetical protein